MGQWLELAGQPDRGLGRRSGGRSRARRGAGLEDFPRLLPLAALGAPVAARRVTGTGVNLFHGSPTLESRASPAPDAFAPKGTSCTARRGAACGRAHRPLPRARAIAFTTSRSISSPNQRWATFSAVSTNRSRGSSRFPREKK